MANRVLRLEDTRRCQVLVSLFTRQGQEKKGFEQISGLVLLITGAAAETSFARHLVKGFLSQRWLEL